MCKLCQKTIVTKKEYKIIQKLKNADKKKGMKFLQHFANWLKRRANQSIPWIFLIGKHGCYIFSISGRYVFEDRTDRYLRSIHNFHHYDTITIGKKKFTRLSDEYNHYFVFKFPYSIKTEASLQRLETW